MWSLSESLPSNTSPRSLTEVIKEVLTHDVVVEFSVSWYVEGESSDFAKVFGSGGGEFGDGVTVIEFVGHFSVVIIDRDVGFIWFSGVDDSQCQSRGLVVGVAPGTVTVQLKGLVRK